MHHLQIIGLNLIMIKMLMIKNNKNGFTLVEIMVALGLFALIAIPAYMFFSYTTSNEIEYHKNVSASRLMETFKNDIKQYSFEETRLFSDANNAPPNTKKIYDEIKSKFSDLEMKIVQEDVDEKTIRFTLTVTWKSRGGGERKETSTCVKVK